MCLPCPRDLKSMKEFLDEGIIESAIATSNIHKFQRGQKSATFRTALKQSAQLHLIIPSTIRTFQADSRDCCGQTKEARQASRSPLVFSGIMATLPHHLLNLAPQGSEMVGNNTCKHLPDILQLCLGTICPGARWVSAASRSSSPRIAQLG